MDKLFAKKSFIYGLLCSNPVIMIVLFCIAIHTNNTMMLAGSLSGLSIWITMFILCIKEKIDKLISTIHDDVKQREKDYELENPDWALSKLLERILGTGKKTTIAKIDDIANAPGNKSGPLGPQLKQRGISWKNVNEKVKFFHKDKCIEDLGGIEIE